MNKTYINKQVADNLINRFKEFASLVPFINDDLAKVELFKLYNKSLNDKFINTIGTTEESLDRIGDILEDINTKLEYRN